jgi:hypothetical protein
MPKRFTVRPARSFPGGCSSAIFLQRRHMSPNGNVSCSRASEEYGMFPLYSDCGVSVVSVSASTQAQTMTFALGSVFPLGKFLEIYSEKRRNSCLFALGRINVDCC